MTASDDSFPQGLKVEVYKLANKLKARLGPDYKNQEEGFLSEDAIKAADNLIAALCVQCPIKINETLTALSDKWDKMKLMEDSPERKAIAAEIFTLAHEIKDVGAMCGYDLIAYFGESLRDFIGRTDLNLKAQVVIIQAHMDAMVAVNRLGAKKDAGPEAEELKRMVKMAIDKYA